jgi:hypothetical protein
LRKTERKRERERERWKEKGEDKIRTQFLLRRQCFSGELDCNLVLEVEDLVSSEIRTINNLNNGTRRFYVGSACSL